MFQYRMILWCIVWIIHGPVWWFFVVRYWVGDDRFSVALAGIAISIAFAAVSIVCLVIGITLYRTEPGSVSMFISREAENLAKNGIKLDNLPRCPKCGSIKPVRASHCKKEGKCYLRMDHYCESLGLVIALGNQRAFIATMLWALNQLFMEIVMTIASWVLYPKRSVVMGGWLLLQVSCFLPLARFAFFHLRRIARNVTLIEQWKGEVGKYDMGIKANLDEYFGHGIPIFRALIPGPAGATGLEWSARTIGLLEV